MNQKRKSRQILTTIICLLCCYFSSNAQISLDTLEYRQVGPGMYYTKYSVPSIPWSIDVFEADITNEYFVIETVKAYELLAAGREKTSQMSAKRNYTGHWTVCAINGDFFNLTTGMPNNIQVENGEVLRNERADWPAIGFNIKNEVSITKPYFSGLLLLKDTALFVNGINIAREEDKLILYNQFYGSSTNTSNPGFEAVINPVTGWLANDTIICTVDSINQEGKNTAVAKGAMVISASGKFSSYLNSQLKIGDSLKVILNILPAVSKLKEMIGGHPIVVKDGSSASMDPNDSFVFTRHPRTAVGINSDTTKLFFITVDGRQTSSAGMNLFELADLMIQLGVFQGINLDGGGSTTMVIRNSIVNSPSDASGERPVSNALLVVSKAPQDTLSFLSISPKFSKIFLGGQIQFSVKGLDRFFNPVFINPSIIKYQLTDSSFGAISSNGLFTAKFKSGECSVIVSYKNISDTAVISIKGVSRLNLTPEEAATDNNRIIIFAAKIYDTENIEQAILPQNISWICTNPEVGSVDIVGQFKGERDGSAQIIASYMGKSDTANIKVEIGSGVTVIDSIETKESWWLSGENIDSLLSWIYFDHSVSVLGNYSLKLNYSFTYQSSFNWAYLNTNNKIYGVPDSIMIDVLTSGDSHRFFFDIEDNESKLFRISAQKLANSTTDFETIKGRIVSSSNVIFPVTLKRISIVLGSTQIVGQTYSSSLYVDNLRVKYPQQATKIESEVKDLSSFQLFQNYPNPFNPATKIRFTIPHNSTFLDINGILSENKILTSLKIFDILGNEVETLINEEVVSGTHEINYSAANELASGIYFYQLKTGNFISTKKMVLMR